MVGQGGNAEKLKAAEILLEAAAQERDEAQSRVDMFRAEVERYRTGQHTNGHARIIIAADGSSSEDTEPGYGGIRRAVYDLMIGVNRKMKMAEIVGRFVLLGIQTEAKSPDRSVRHALKGLMKQHKVKKVGALYYRAVPEVGE